MKNITIPLFVFAVLISAFNLTAKDKSRPEADSLKNIQLTGLSFRSIGPAVTGGRVVALAVNPFDHSEYYVGAGHGSLWKTSNNGTTFSPVFDNQNSYAIGAIAIDPTNPNVVWVGTVYDGVNRAQGGHHAF